MSDGVFVRCKHRSDDAEKRRVVLNMPTRYATYTHARHICIYNLLRQNRFRRSTRLERFCQYTDAFNIVRARANGHHFGRG